MPEPNTMNDVKLHDLMESYCMIHFTTACLLGLSFLMIQTRNEQLLY